MTKQVDEFKNRLLIAMNYRNITQIELSQKSGVDKGSISHYLKGTYEPKLGKAQKLAKALNVSLEWLMGADSPMLKESKTSTIDIKLLSELIKRYREKNNLSLRDFAKKANVSHTYISMLEKNYNPATKKEPVVNTINLNNIALALGIGLDELIDNISNDTIVELKAKPKKVELKEIKSSELFLNPDLDLSEMVRIPIVSTVPASFNKSSDFIYDEYIEYPISLLQYSDYDKRYIALRIKGNSMYPEFFDGDSVLVDIFLEVQNGNIGVFAFNDTFTVKRIYFQKDTVVFKPSNPEYQEKVYTKKQLHEMGYHPIGRVVKIIERNIR